MLHLLNRDICFLGSTTVAVCLMGQQTRRRTRSALVLPLLNSDFLFVWQHDYCGLRDSPSDWEKNPEYSSATPVYP